MLTERSPRIAAAHRLLRRSRRTETGEFLAEGAPAVTEAIAYARDHPGEVLELFVTEAAAAKHVERWCGRVRGQGRGHPGHREGRRGAVRRGHPAGPRRPLRASADHASPTCWPVRRSWSRCWSRANDPGNAGTVIRLADAAGADGVILAGDSVDAFNPKAIRASAGSLFHLPVARAADPAALLDELSAAGLSVLATTGAAELDLDAASADGILDLPTAWLFGSEAHGLPDDVRRARRRGRAGADLRPGGVAQPGQRGGHLPVRQCRGTSAGRQFRQLAVVELPVYCGTNIAARTCSTLRYQPSGSRSSMSMTEAAALAETAATNSSFRSAGPQQVAGSTIPLSSSRAARSNMSMLDPAIRPEVCQPLVGEPVQEFR